MSLSTRLSHPCRDARHQDFVVDSVEKYFEIEIDHNVVAVGDVALCLAMARQSGVLPYIWCSVSDWGWTGCPVVLRTRRRHSGPAIHFSFDGFDPADLAGLVVQEVVIATRTASMSRAMPLAKLLSSLLAACEIHSSSWRSGLRPFSFCCRLAERRQSRGSSAHSRDHITRRGHVIGLRSARLHRERRQLQCLIGSANQNRALFLCFDANRRPLRSKTVQPDGTVARSRRGGAHPAMRDRIANPALERTQSVLAARLRLPEYASVVGPAISIVAQRDVPLGGRSSRNFSKAPGRFGNSNR